jgi:nicotinamidase-related amidase
MKTGLILVDIQNDYFPGGRMELVGIKEASIKARNLLDYFREKQLPTCHIQHIFLNANAGFFIPKTDGIEIHESAKPLSGELVIQKNYPNSFLKTRLFYELKKAEIDELVICGAMSHMCIDATTRAAVDFGLKCVIVHDACATKDLQFNGKTIPADEVHGSFMNALGFAYANIVDFKEFMSNNSYKDR